MRYRHRLKPALVSLVIVVVAGFLGFGLLYLYTERGTLPSGVTVGGYPLGSMKIDEALDRLSVESERMLKGTVVLTIGNTHIHGTWKQIGASHDFEKIRAAFTNLSEGGIWSRAKARYHFPKEWDLPALWDPSRLKQALNEDWEQRKFGEPVNALRWIGAGDQIRYQREKTVQRIDWNALGELMKRKIPLILQDKSDRSSQPVTIELPLKTTAPPVTLDSLKQQGIVRKIMQFSTSLGASSEGRVHNVEATARAVDGTLLAPGDIFDFGEAILRAQRDYGYKEAPVIIEGRMVPGIGGGICQVSGTLYGAAIRAGLGIVERRNHSAPVKYLPKGQDATFSQGNINFRFRNTTSSHLLITAKFEGRRLVIKFFGNMPENIRYEIRSKVVETLTPPIRYINNPALPEGGREVMKTGKAGYIVETYRIKYVNGAEQGTETISRDTYPAQPMLIAIRSTYTDFGSSLFPEDHLHPPFIEDGIRTLEPLDPESLP